MGGLSGSIYRHVIDINEDKIANSAEDEWNRKILSMMEQGDYGSVIMGLSRLCRRGGRVDMGFKHFAFILGAIGGSFSGATVHAYGPLYGSGGAVVEFDLT